MRWSARCPALPPDAHGLLTVVAGCVTLRLTWPRYEAAEERLELGADIGIPVGVRRKKQKLDPVRPRQRPADTVSAVPVVDIES